MIRVLTEAEFRQEAEPALKQLFRTPEPILSSYGEAAESRKIVYEYRTPDFNLIPLLAQIAADLGDEGFFFSNLLRHPDSPELNHWWIPFEAMSVFLCCDTDFFGSAHVLESAVYSPKSHWGIIRAFDGWGILAGRNCCIDRLLSLMPEVDRQVLDWLNAIEADRRHWGAKMMRLDWLPLCLELTYGEERAIALLQETHLDR